MFGKQKYVYTCPDSIHDHAVAKRRGRIVLGLYAAIYGGAYAALKIQERRTRNVAPTDYTDPTV